MNHRVKKDGGLCNVGGSPSGRCRGKKGTWLGPSVVFCGSPGGRGANVAATFVVPSTKAAAMYLKRCILAPGVPLGVGRRSCLFFDEGVRLVRRGVQLRGDLSL